MKLQLKSYVPSTQLGPQFYHLSPWAPPVVGDDHSIKIWNTKIANGAAAATSGFTGDHGKVLLEDADCLRGLACMVFCILNGLVDDRCRDMVLSSPLLGVPKLDDGLRPVTIKETIYKMAAAFGLDEVTTIATEILGIDQFAILAGGAESAALTIKALIEHHTAVATDLKNAYNSFNRHSILEELYSHPRLAPLFRIADWSYSRPTKLLAFNQRGELVDTMYSSEGVHQGDTLASLMFCLALKPVIDKAKLDGGPDVTVVADADDVTFAGPTDGKAVIRSMISFKQGIERKSGTFNARKSYVVAMHNHPLSTEVTEITQQLGMRIEREACVLLGTPCGRNEEAVQALALKIAQKSDRFFKSLTDPKMSANC
jgi:hypothetical protein